MAIEIHDTADIVTAVRPGASAADDYFRYRDAVICPVRASL
jgi:hypothetical protein